jgi:ATP phosphoribosyltransferase
MKVPSLVDAIVVNTETGSSLRAHNLKIVGEPLLVSTTRVVANKVAWEDAKKRAKIENLAMLLTGALNAGALVGLKLNVAQADFDAVIAQLPALKKPTVSPLFGDAGFAVEIIIEEHQARDLIPRLKRAGAEGIVEYPLHKVVY